MSQSPSQAKMMNFLKCSNVSVIDLGISRLSHCSSTIWIIYYLCDLQSKNTQTKSVLYNCIMNICEFETVLCLHVLRVFVAIF